MFSWRWKISGTRNLGNENIPKQGLPAEDVFLKMKDLWNKNLKNENTSKRGRPSWRCLIADEINPGEETQRLKTPQNKDLPAEYLCLKMKYLQDNKF